jgi:hypothetical protein
MNLQLQKEKEENVQEGHERILEETNIQLKKVKVKLENSAKIIYNILPQANIIEDQGHRLECFTLPKRRMDASLVESEGETSKVEPY